MGLEKLGQRGLNEIKVWDAAFSLSQEQHLSPQQSLDTGEAGTGQ